MLPDCALSACTNAGAYISLVELAWKLLRPAVRPVTDDTWAQTSGVIASNRAVFWPFSEPPNICICGYNKHCSKKQSMKMITRLVLKVVE